MLHTPSRRAAALALLAAHAVTVGAAYAPGVSASAHRSQTLPWNRKVPPQMAMPSWVPEERLREIGEPAAQAAFDNMQTVELDLPSDVATGPCATTYLKTNVAASASQPPVLLVHGFDISSLEYRRLLLKLEVAGIEAYAPCIAGWGFTDTTALRSVGVEAKRAQLLAFWETVLGGRPAVWVGASLGACIALDCYQARPEAVASFASLAPGFFTPPPPVVPAPVGRLLLKNVLSSPDVRASIAKQAYHVKEDQTDDAIRCGNLHCFNRAKWEDDSLEWLLGGAYGDQSPQVAALRAVPCLTLWGREDEVIPPEGFGAWPAGQLASTLPESTFRWVDASGHTPHLEQPDVTAAALAAFVRGEPVQGAADVSAVAAPYRRWEAVRADVDNLQGKLGEAIERVKAAAK